MVLFNSKWHENYKKHYIDSNVDYQSLQILYMYTLCQSMSTPSNQIFKGKKFKYFAFHCSYHFLNYNYQTTHDTHHQSYLVFTVECLIKRLNIGILIWICPCCILVIRTILSTVCIRPVYNMYSFLSFSSYVAITVVIVVNVFRLFYMLFCMQRKISQKNKQKIKTLSGSGQLINT